jgi:hypothetical protein
MEKEVVKIFLKILKIAYLKKFKHLIKVFLKYSLTDIV